MVTKLKSSPAVLETAYLARQLGITCLPISLSSKATGDEGWSSSDYVTDWNAWTKDDLGIGMVLGGQLGIIDIDVDDPRITGLCKSLLPDTNWRYGRKSKKSSHFVYRAANVAEMPQNSEGVLPFPCKSTAFRGISLPASTKSPNNVPTVILEFRGDGNQSVLPGTLHEGTGELVEWEAGRPSALPPEVDPYELRRICKIISLIPMIADHAWQDGIRHEVTLCLAGMMVANKWQEADARTVFAEVINFTGDGERGNVLRTVKDTFKRFHAGERISGGPKLSELLGHDALATKFRQLFSDRFQAAFDEFDEQYVAIMHYGTFGIGQRAQINDVSKPDFSVMKLSDFKALNSNKFFMVADSRPRAKPGDKKRIDMGQLWLDHPKRETFYDTHFAPGQPLTDGNSLNLWRGWAAKPNPHASCDLWLSHVKNFICSGDEDVYTWVMAWLADMVQDPMQKAGTALVLCSSEGTGKGTFADMLARMLGRRYYKEMTQSEHVTSKYNAGLEHTILLFANEATFAKDPRNRPVLNGMVTDETFEAEQKHMQSKTAQNYLRLMLASNKHHVIERSATDRRFTVLDVRNIEEERSKQQVREYFTALKAEVLGDGPSALLSHLMGIQYDKWDIRRPVITKAALRQTIMSMSPAIQFWVQCLQQGSFVVDEEHQDGLPPVGAASEWHEKGWPCWIAKSAYENAFMNSRYAKRCSAVEMWIDFFKQTGLENDTRRRRTPSGRKNVLMLPPLDQCVELLDKRYPGAIDLTSMASDDEEEATLEQNLDDTL